MLYTNFEKKINGFYVKRRNHEQTVLGIQDPNNKRRITYIYDEKTKRHIGKLVDNI